MLDFLNYRFDLLALVLTVCAGVMLVFQEVYHFAVYGKLLSFFRKKNKHKGETLSVSNESEGVSVIIVTNNNGDALRESLLQILEQDYPLFEVVVVNENSSDDTEFILYVLKENYPNLTVINLGKNDNKFESYKFSLAIGIRSAKYNHVLLTDVSCKPKGFDWITKMMAPVNEASLEGSNVKNKRIVTGLCLREKAKGLAGMLEKYGEVIDNMNLLSYTLLHNAYTSCGMNMVYDKQWLIDKGGFIAQYALACNQEDYFVHRHTTKHNTAVVVDKESVLYLPAYNSWGTFFRVKFAKSLSHKVLAGKDKVLLALNPVTSFLYYVLITLLLIFSFPWQYIVVSTVIKWITQIVFFKKGADRLGIKKNCITVPLDEIFFFFFNFIIRVKVLFYRKKEKKIRWD